MLCSCHPQPHPRSLLCDRGPKVLGGRNLPFLRLPAACPSPGLLSQPRSCSSILLSERPCFPLACPGGLAVSGQWGWAASQPSGLALTPPRSGHSVRVGSVRAEGDTGTQTSPAARTSPVLGSAPSKVPSKVPSRRWPGWVLRTGRASLGLPCLVQPSPGIFGGGAIVGTLQPFPTRPQRHCEVRRGDVRGGFAGVADVFGGWESFTPVHLASARVEREGLPGDPFILGSAGKAELQEAVWTGWGPAGHCSLYP